MSSIESVRPKCDNIVCCVPRLAREKISEFKFKITLIMRLQLFRGLVWNWLKPFFYGFAAIVVGLCGHAFYTVLEYFVTSLILYTWRLCLAIHCTNIANITYVVVPSIRLRGWNSHIPKQSRWKSPPTEKKHLFWNHGFCCDISWILPDDYTREFDENTIRW